MIIEKRVIQLELPMHVDTAHVINDDAVKSSTNRRIDKIV